MTISYTVYARLDETVLITRAGDTLIDRADSDTLVARGQLTDITSDVVQDSVSWTKGIPGKGPMDRIATTGNLNLSLRNDAGNSTGLLGAYSPDNTNCRYGWTVGAGLQLVETNGTTSKYTYWRVSEIEPEMGQYLSRKVNVTAVDFIDQMSSQKIDGLYTQLGADGQYIIWYVINSMVITPAVFTIGSSSYTFPVALDSVDRDESTTIYSVVNKVVSSDMGYFFSPSDTTYGETVKYESYGVWTGKASAGTFTDNLTEMSVTRNAEKIYNDIRITVYPRRVDTTDGTLTQLDYELTLAASGTANINMRYLDQNSNTRVSAYSIQNQVSGTDYRMSSVAGDSGTDLTDNLGISLDLASSNTMNVILTNVGTVTGYVNLFQLRGKAIKTYTQVEAVATDNSSVAQFGRRTLRYSMPYQSDPIVGQEFANTILAAYKQPSTDVDGMKYITRAGTSEAYAMSLNVGDKITLSETVTGISAKDFYIGSEGHTLGKGYAVIEYGLIPE